MTQTNWTEQDWKNIKALIGSAQITGNAATMVAVLMAKIDAEIASFHTPEQPHPPEGTGAM